MPKTVIVVLTTDDIVALTHACEFTLQEQSWMKPSDPIEESLKDFLQRLYLLED